MQWPVIDVTARAEAHGDLIQGTAAGAAITLRNMVRHLPRRPDQTILYPERRKAYSGRFRGVHVLTQRADGSLKCVACYLCATACPAECITIEAAEAADPAVEKVASRYEIDLARCVFCGFCVDACPEEAIVMTREYDQAVYERGAQATYGISELTERPEIAAYGAGYRPHAQYPLVESYLPDEVRAKVIPGPAKSEDPGGTG